MRNIQYTAILRLISSSENLSEHQPVYLLSSIQTIALGRHPQCGIVLDPAVYRSVSRWHAEIGPVMGFESADGKLFWQISDLSSSNGTFVNGKAVQGSQVLHPGDRITLGRDGPVFVFDYQSSFPPEPVKAEVVSAHPGSEMRRTQPPAPSTSSVTDRDPVSLTQLFPILSTGRQLAHKAYLMPAMATIAFVVLLFWAVGNAIAFNLLLATYLAGAAFYFIYRLCGKPKPWWVLLTVALATALILVSPLLNSFVVVFRQILPGSIPSSAESVSLPVLFGRMWVGAGLMEELIKALPVLGFAWLGSQLRHPWRDRIGVWEPLDGILLGTASAVGFTLIETLGQYVPEMYQAALPAGEELAQLAGLQLLIPRLLGSIAGHLAYSGYLGYFIGLSMLRARQRWLILLIGYFTAASLHALWNTVGSLHPLLLALVGIMSYAFLGAAILKARRLSPTRSQNFATRLLDEDDFADDDNPTL